jgi:putative FmdB family regulatory protein
MPIYEYRCEKCGDFERTQRITDEALQRCPTCRRKVRKLISNTSFQLKGSGWYVTDYARAGATNGKGENAGADAKADTASTGSESPAKAESSPSESASESAKSGSTKSESPKTPKPGKTARSAAKSSPASKSGS